MKVNIYDPDNVEKGKLMLANIAEDLKEYAKVKVSPLDQTVKAPEEKVIEKGMSKKSAKIEEIKKEAERQKGRKDEIILDDEDEDEFEGKSNYVYMELQSTVSFREIDIDKMLEHTTLDDFLRGLYVNSLGQSVQRQSQQDKIMSML